MDQKEEFNINACFHLAGAVIYSAIIIPSIKEKERWSEIRKNNIEFAKNSPLIQLWADCSNIDESRIRKLIININSKNYGVEEIQKFKRSQSFFEYIQKRKESKSINRNRTS